MMDTVHYSDVAWLKVAAVFAWWASSWEGVAARREEIEPFIHKAGHSEETCGWSGFQGWRLIRCLEPVWQSWGNP